MLIISMGNHEAVSQNAGVLVIIIFNVTLLFAVQIYIFGVQFLKWINMFGFAQHICLWIW